MPMICYRKVTVQLFQPASNHVKVDEIWKPGVSSVFPFNEIAIQTSYRQSFGLGEFSCFSIP